MTTAIYVHDTPCTPYAEAIVEGIKTIETRTKDTLAGFIGQRVLVIRTRNHRPAEIVGSVTIARKTFCFPESFRELYDRHLVPPGSKYDCTVRGKWCYDLEDPEKYDPVPLNTLNVKRKTRVYALIED